MDLVVFIALLVMLFLTVITLSITVYILVSLITRDNDSKTYLLTRLFLKLGDAEGLTLEEQQYYQSIVSADVKETSKPFNPHAKFEEENPLGKPPEDFDV